MVGLCTYGYDIIWFGRPVVYLMAGIWYNRPMVCNGRPTVW